jgi:tetratricopeptide (TPR) repeat protein
MKRSLAFLPVALLLASVVGTARAQTQPAYTHEAAEKLYRGAKYAEDQALCTQAIAAIEKSNGPKAWQLAEPLTDLATLYMRQARYAEAKQAIDRADSVLDKNVPAQALIYARLGINKGWRLYTFGETEGGLKVFQEALGLLDKFAPEPSIDRAELINNIGLMYESQGEKNEDDELTQKARIDLLRGWEMRRQLTGDYSPESGESLNNLSMHLFFNPQSGDDLRLGLRTLRKSLEVATKVYGESHPETAVSHAVLAMALLVTGSTDEAEKEIRIAIPMTQKFLGDRHPDLAMELSTLGHVLQKQAHFDDAEKKFLEALSIQEEVYGKTHRNIVSTLESLKTLYEEKGDPAKAQDMEKRIAKISGKDI